ncbi:hypothetical protein PCANC_03603 [Puccinia coronata f. sp. avenae]|uniref:Uncharacterized protein n=1 Tax=Puccinia coronata f. sp. avenae TaxID=200324 RepID=A0A2N5VV14_9BASI|nr:hypothetical protein PCANC_03603 [Puccinia coronata f. sp. avenae]
MHLSRLDRQVSSQGDLRPPMGASATNKPGGSFAFSPAPCGSQSAKIEKGGLDAAEFPDGAWVSSAGIILNGSRRVD